MQAPGQVIYYPQNKNRRFAAERTDRKMKRMISFLLVLVLICGLTPAVFAADNQNKDYVAFYMTKYQVQAGDTLSSICTTRGLKLADYLTIIKNVNGLANENSLIAGRDYWIPSTTLGSATEYYSVYRHVLVGGDTISGLCSSYGISFANNEAMLKGINNVTNLTSFMAGTSIYIPVPSGTKAPAAAVTPAPAGTTPAPAATPAPTGTKAPAANAANQNKDYAVYYLTPYTVQAGDTLVSICTTRGINFADYLTVIQNVNKMASYNYLIAGQDYWIPSTTVGNAKSYYTIYKHVLAAGDTVYNLCQTYGIPLTKSSDFIMKLNNVTSLTGFMAGQAILLPVFHEGGTGTTPGAVIGGTPTDVSAAAQTTGTSTTVQNADGTTTTTTTVTTVKEEPNLFNATTADAYYLVPVTVKSGDSLVGICNAKGSSFSANKDLIATVNGLNSYAVSVGQSIYVPTNNPGGAAKYISVKVHTVAAGDTMFGIVTAAGGDFNASYKLLTDLNAGVNFNWIQVGQKLSIPVYVG